MISMKVAVYTQYQCDNHDDPLDQVEKAEECAPQIKCVSETPLANCFHYITQDEECERIDDHHIKLLTGLEKECV